MEDSILLSTKKILGLDPSYTVFDPDIIMHINAAFSVLTQLGVGPETGFMIEDEYATWSDFVLLAGSEPSLNLVKSYIYLKVRFLFDPPTTSYMITAMENQIKEHEWRLNVFREYLMPIPEPDPEVPA